MTTPAISTAGLGGLSARLERGVCGAARRSRPADWDYRDRNALGSGWPAAALACLAGIRDVPWETPDQPGQVIASLSAAFRATPALLATVLYAPATVLAQLLTSSVAAGSPAGGAVIDAWIALCWTAEGAWAAIAAGLPVAAGYGAGDTDLLRPLAARLRFLVLSEPMRWRGQDSGAWWAWEPDEIFGASGVLDRTLGERSWGLVVSRCQESRRLWQQCLDEYQSHPLLSQARPAELEQELNALLFSGQVRRAPLILSVRPLAEQTGPTAADKNVADEVADRHLLPRFDLAGVLALAAYDDHRRGRVIRRAIASLAALAGLATVTCAALLQVRTATAAAAVCYALIGVGAVVYGTAWAAPWLLRLPAAAAVGVIALVSILPGGWVDAAGPPSGGLAVLALAAASCGYLLVQARNHGLVGRSLWRAVAVAAIGAVHALMVSLIGLVVVAPAFIANGSSLAVLWRHPGYRHAGLLLALATVWCLAVGVFSQILWEDRPITAALAHLSWRSGR